MFPFFSFRFIQLVWRSIFSLPQNPAHPYNVTLVSNIKILPPYFPGCIPCLTLKPLCPRSIYYVLCFPRGNPTNRVISTRSFFIIDLPTNNQENRDWLEHWILARVSQYGSGVRLCSSWHGGGLQEPPLVSHILPRGFPTHSCTKSLYQSITHIIGHKLKFLFHTTTKNSRQTPSECCIWAQSLSLRSQHGHKRTNNPLVLLLLGWVVRRSWDLMAPSQERTTTRGTGQKWKKADTATTSKLSFSLIADPGGQRPGEPPVQGGQGGQGVQGSHVG